MRLKASVHGQKQKQSVNPYQVPKQNAQQPDELTQLYIPFLGSASTGHGTISWKFAYNHAYL